MRTTFRKHGVRLGLTPLALAVIASCSGGSSSDGRTGTTGAGSGTPVTGAGTGTAGKNAFGNGATQPGQLPTQSTMSTVDAGMCVNLQCQKTKCTGSAKTTISGKVYDPAGKNPIYNVAVYVPNEPVQPLKSGASCDTCDSLYTGNPVAAGLTDATGQFEVDDAPDGANIPLVIQVGKWRKQITLPMVRACADNPLPDKMLTLPKSHMEGDIPNMAVSTGGADTLECLLARVGVDPAEYVPGEGGPGRLHIFQGSARGGGLGGLGGGGQHNVPNTSPAAPMAPMAMWDTLDHLMQYDIVLLSCEGAETQMMNQQAMHDYASAGGRVFASHFHYSWFNTGPYGMENLATWTTGSNSIGNINGTIVTTLPNGQPFPKGQALAMWLGTVGALTNGELPIEQARHNADVSATNTPSQPWILSDQSAMPPGATEYFSFNTPTNAQMTPDGPGYCGRVVYSDLHVGAASMDDPSQPVPAECTNRDLSPQEKALEFMLFDLSSCLTPNNVPPRPPTIKVQ
ncbi:MAG: carboxypeptidase regulatory-like domain-containing protein [Polyangiales bacterium]